jgi:hypothetical protein
MWSGLAESGGDSLVQLGEHCCTQRRKLGDLAIVEALEEETLN